MHPMLNIAVRAARAGGKIIMRNFDRLDRVRVTEKSAKDFVSDVDRQAEAEIVHVLHKAYPDHGFLAEESGEQAGAAADGYRWIIDPLDGTTNFLHGFPQFAVSIALAYRNRLEQAVVYNPVSQDIYTASRGAGAELNNRRIRVSSCRSLNTALLGTGLPFREGDDFDAEFAVLRTFAEKTVGIRRPGAAALDLAAVAAGQFDGFYESRLQAWDIAAGALLVREAGGLITDLAGDENWLQSGAIVAATPKLLPELLATLQPHATAMTAGHKTSI
ncbi:MAG: inositol monophosphatase family protein [Pseudomonadota bacterium]